MIINTTGNRTVDEMAKINFTGNVIPNSWFYTFRDEKGNINTMALMILSEIVYWYRPTIERTETGEKYVKRFSSDLLQKSYKDLCDRFGLGKSAMQRNLAFLESFGVIKRVFRTITTKNDTKLSNVMFIELNIERLKEMTFPNGEAVKNEQKEMVIEENLEEDVRRSSQTLCEEVHTPYVQKFTHPMCKSSHTNTENTNTENTNTENTNTEITNTSHHQKDNIYNNIYNINNIVSDDEVEIIDEDFNSNEIVECKNDIDKNNLSLDSQVDYVFELWQKKAKQFGFASIYRFTASRKNMMKNRIKDYTLGGVLKALEIACSSDFLCGKVNGYKMDWEFFCRPNKISEIHEGKYSNRYKAQSFNTKNKNSMEQDLDVLRDWRNEKEMTANGF